MSLDQRAHAVNQGVRELRSLFNRALRLMFFGTAVSPAIEPSRFSLSVLFVVFLTLSATLDALSAYPDFYFSERGLVAAFASLGVFMAGISISSGRARTLRMGMALADMLTVGCICLVLIIIVRGGDFLQEEFAHGARILNVDDWHILPHALFGWALIAYWRAGNQLWRVPLRWPGARFAAAVLLAVVLIPQKPILYGVRTSWASMDAWTWSRQIIADLYPTIEVSYGDETEFDSDIERTIYRQSSLLTGTLGSVFPAPGKQPQLFFLGVAPSDAQDVFRREVVSAKELFDSRFGTYGHSAVLINSSATLDTVPLASNTSLEMALLEFGKVMNRERDVLVLFITSHGANGIVSVDLPGYPFNQITPSSLANSLDQAFIKNRVLIISACHSGSFIPELAGPNTLIMTAASADRTSFGCANGRDWTYFGDALFNHAFREETSFIQAFAKADSLIKSWEFWRIFLKPSQPQISVGLEIAAVLEQVEIAAQHWRAAASR